jgi:hypothetical protein
MTSIPDPILDPDTQDRLRRAQKVNALLLAALVVVLLGVAAVGGWLLGRNGSTPHGVTANVPHDCPFDLSGPDEALVRGIRCQHGTLVIDAHCEDGHAMKRFILDLRKEGLSDEEIKAALLRRYGDKALAGREW